ncbi:MAG TPA: hypothetical protein VJR30_16525 [Bradyrhizobium sp.]|nr:hypothetical protein [Bradyrhizobium sp.]
MAENALKYRLFRHSAQQSSQKSAVAVQEMPYFAADSRAAAVPQLGFPITRRSDSLEKPYKKAAPGDSWRGLGCDSLP